MERTPDYEGVTPLGLEEWLDAGDSPVLLDVREPWGFALTRFP